MVNGIVNRCNEFLPSPIVIILLSLLLISISIITGFMALLCFLILYHNFYQLNLIIFSINPLYSFIEFSYYIITAVCIMCVMLIDVISEIIIEMISKGYGIYVINILFLLCLVIYVPIYFFSRKLYKSAISKDD